MTELTPLVLAVDSALIGHDRCIELAMHELQASLKHQKPHTLREDLGTECIKRRLLMEADW